MTKILETLREELHEVNKKILEHPCLMHPTMDLLRRFTVNQLYIVPHDAKALSILLSRTRFQDEAGFFKSLVDGDFAAHEALVMLGRELEVKRDYGRISPRAVAYTHFLSWLSLHGTMGDAALSLTVNLPAWGANVEKLGRWTKKNGVKNTRFMELFKGPYDKLEEEAEPIIIRYMDEERYRYLARAIQQYELDFWDGIA